MYQYRTWGLILGLLLPALFHVCLGWPLWIAALASAGALIVSALRFEVQDKRTWLWTGAAVACMTVRLSIGQTAPVWELPEIFLRARRRVSEQLTILFPEPHAAFMAGLLTGERSDLPKSVLDDMRATGLTHILAISGFNITLVLVFLEKCLFFIPQRIRLLPLVAGVILFTLFTGASASVVRACIMGILQLLALHVGRPSQMRILIGWTAAGMTFYDPIDLRDDLGMHLSFLAVLGLVEFSPLLLEWGKRFPETLGIREALLTTIAAQITAGPYSAYRFGTLPLHSPILNLFVAPLLPLSMLSGATALVASLFSETLGRLFALPGWLAMTFILRVGHEGARMDLFVVDDLQESRLLLFAWGVLVYALYKAMPALMPGASRGPSARTDPS